MALAAAAACPDAGEKGIGKPHGSAVFFRALAPLALAAVAAMPAFGAAVELDLAKLDELRSLVAEAAALQMASAHGRLTTRYADGLRADLRRDLGPLVAEPALGPLARESLAALDRRDAAAIGHCRDQLVAIERSHGRAD